MKVGYRRRLKQASGALLWIVAIIVAYISALYLGSLLATVFAINDLVGRLALHSVLLAFMVTLVVWLPVAFGRSRLTLHDIGIQRPVQWRDGLWAAVGFVIYALIMTIVAQLLEKIAWFNTEQPQQLGFDGMSGVSLFIGFIVLTLLTPIAEEVLFRGILQGKLRQNGIPFVATALIVGGLFGLAHGQWNVGIDVFFMSLVASYLREKTGRLWPSIILHIIKNSLAFYVAFVLMAGTVR